jgi:hypothetical protein
MSKVVDLDTMFGDSTTRIKYGGQLFYAHPVDFIERGLIRQSREPGVDGLTLADRPAFELLLPIFERRRVNPKVPVDVDRLLETTPQALGKFFAILIDQDVTDPN